MPTRRTPINRRPTGKLITREALAAFRRLYEAKSREDWKTAHDELMDLITDKPWPYPVVVEPCTPWDGRTSRESYDEARRNWDILESALLASAEPEPT